MKSPMLVPVVIAALAHSVQAGAHAPDVRGTSPAAVQAPTTEDAVARDIRLYREAYDALVAANRKALAEGKSGASVNLSPLIEQYYPSISKAAEAGDASALAWCIGAVSYTSPSIEKALGEGRPAKWWKAYVGGETSDEDIRRVLRALPSTWYALGDGVYEGCELLYARARTPELKALALETEALLLDGNGETKRAAAVLGRLTSELPETPSAKRALAKLLQQSVLREGQPFPGYGERRFIDLGRALESRSTSPEDLAKNAGTSFRLADYKGKVVALIFWDYYCGFCMEELPFEREMYARLAPRGFEVIGVYTDPDLAHFDESAAKRPVPWRNVWDAPGKMRGGPLCTDLGVRGVPFTVVLDRDGVVRTIGARKEQLEQAIVRVLDSTPPKPSGAK